jgi:hypothetical protein
MLEELKRKGLPGFIKNNAVLNGMNKIEKVFPKLGLVNTEEAVGGLYAEKDAAIATVRDVANILERKSRLLKKFGDVKTVYGWHRNKRGRSVYTKKVACNKDWISRRNSVVAMMTKLSDQIKKNPNSFVKLKKSSALLVLPKKNGTLNSKLVEISKQLKKLKQPKLRLHKISKNEIKNKTVVFSSDGAKGLWDIATMSMRGIRSCQSWGSSHRNCLIGSIADPFAGIIYVSGKDRTNKGSKMHYRSVVRLVVTSRAGKPTYLIERVYPRGLRPDQVNQAVSLFKSFIRKHSSAKYPIVYSKSDFYNRYAIPYTKQTRQATDQGYISYRDSRVQYRDIALSGELSKLLQ